MPKTRIRFRRDIKAQAEAFDDDVSFYNMYQGGYGSGKTAFLVYKTIKLSWLNRNISGGILAPSLPEFKRDFLPMMLEIMMLEIPGAEYLSSGKFGMHFMFPWSNAPVYVFTAERPIKGPNLGWAVINEYSLMEFDRIKEMIARVRRKNTPVRQICFAGTPEDEYLWLEEFTAKHLKTEKLKLRTATSFDNPFNDENYAQDLLDNLDEQAAQVYVYGKAVRLGKDYFFYAYKPSVNDFPVQQIDGKLIHACVDFNVGRMSASFCHIIGEDRTKQAIWFDELKVKGITADTQELGEAIKARYGTENLLITCDASGKARKTSGLSDVKVLEKLGFKIRYKQANPRIRRSQLIVNGLLAKRKILINPDVCKFLKRDLLKVEQKADFEMDKSNLELTHMSDGMRYLCDWEFPDFLDRAMRDKYHVGRM